MKHLFQIALLLTAIIIMISCSDEEKNPTQPNNKPTITSISSQTAAIFDVVTINGSNFGSSQGSSFVSFSGIKATGYQSWSDTEIQVIVPEETTDGTVWVEVNGEKSNELEFAILQIAKVYISEIDPNSAYVGDFVLISGMNFGTSRNFNYVSFAGTQAIDYETWNNRGCIVKVPEGAVSGKLWVFVNGEKSNEVDFTVKETDPGNYEAVTIGNQVWMKKNLDVTHYRNGDSIPEVKDFSQWANLKTGAWCYYRNSKAEGEKYGKLYNWYAVNDPRGLAPEGWRVPTYTDWTDLYTYLGGSLEVGGMLKATGTIEGGDGLWLSPNTGATNSSGFTALPGGERTAQVFPVVGMGGRWWTSKESHSQAAFSVGLWYSESSISWVSSNKEYGFSVRCVRD